MPRSVTDLLQRSVKTLAWLGDVEFEREVRWRLASRGDFPIDRLDAMKTRVVCAPAQAALLAEVLPRLSEGERALVRRGRNAAPAAGARSGRQGIASYRDATAFEVLVASWCYAQPPDRERMHEVLDEPLTRAIDEAVASRARRPRRG